MTDVQKNEILRLRAQNVPYSEIARRLGLSKNTLKSFMHRRGQFMEPESTSECALCGKPLVQLPHKKPKRFCDKACRYTYWNHNRTASNAVCARCGAGFNNRGNSAQKYCSTSCYSNARWGVANG